MVSSVISFRASGEFLDWLQSQAVSGESPSQAAQRLLKIVFDAGNNDAFDTLDTCVNTVTPGLDLILQRLDRLESRLSQLESSPESVPAPIAIDVSDADADADNKQLTIFDTLEEVETSLKASGLLGLSIEEEQNYLLQEDFDKLQSEYDALLESSSRIISKFRAEVSDLRFQFEIQERDRDELEEKLNQAELELMTSKSHLKLPDASEVLNSLKSRRKKQHKACSITLADVEAIFKFFEA